MTGTNPLVGTTPAVCVTEVLMVASVAHNRAPAMVMTGPMALANA